MRISPFLLLGTAVFSLAGDFSYNSKFDTKGAMLEKYKSLFSVELGLPGKGIKSLPQGAAYSRGLVQAGKHLLGTTYSKRKGVVPVSYLFDLKNQEIVDIRAFTKPVDGEFAFGLVKTSAGEIYTGTFANGKTGFIYKLTVKKNKIKAKKIKSVIKGQGIYCLEASADGKTLYGITFPSNTFFTLDLKSKKVKTYSKSALSKDLRGKSVRHGELGALLSRDLGQDKEGRIYGSMSNGQLFRFDQGADSLETIGSLPGRSYRRSSRSWVLAQDGMLYGGTSQGGRFFRLDPNNLNLIDLGKPLNVRNHINGLVAIKGMIYGIGGEYPDQSGLFTYNIKSRAYNKETEDMLAYSGFPRYWMFPKNATSYSAKYVSTITQLDQNWIVFGEEVLFPALVFHKVAK